MLKKLLGAGAAAAGFALMAGGSFAAVTPIVVDTGVSDQLTNVLSSFATQALSILGSVLPIAGGVMIAVAVVFAAVSWFRGLIHH